MGHDHDHEPLKPNPPVPVPVPPETIPPLPMLPDPIPPDPMPDPIDPQPMPPMPNGPIPLTAVLASSACCRPPAGVCAQVYAGKLIPTKTVAAVSSCILRRFMMHSSFREIGATIDMHA